MTGVRRLGSGGRLRVRLLRVSVDAALIAGAMGIAYLMRFEGRVPARQLQNLWPMIGLAVVLKLSVFGLFRMHRFSWRHIGFGELFISIVGCIAGSSALASVLLALQPLGLFAGASRSVLAIDFALSLVGVLGVRMALRLYTHALGYHKRSGPKAIVIGAGDAGAQLVRALAEESEPTFQVVGYLDDDPAKLGMSISGARVLGPRSALVREVARHEASAVLVAMPSASAGAVRETVAWAQDAGVRDIKIVPYLSELYSGRVTSSELRDVQPEDVLRREPVRVPEASVEAFLAGRRVLVTGAAGSIGSEICRQVLRFGAAEVLAVDFNETGLFYLEKEIRRQFSGERIRVLVSDVRDPERMRRLFEKTSPEVVLHAAAYKHVPMMEEFPSEAFRSNVVGTRNVLDEACRAGCEAFVLISTDKAVQPTSVMGATKRVAELLVSAKTSERTRCMVVRFGNVLGSRGSVLRTFREKIAQRQPITITHPDMVRYFMVTAEAVLLVLHAGAIGRSGDVLVLDMGEPVRILDLAKDVIHFYGLEPNTEVPIVFTETRPGEKLYEELLTPDEKLAVSTGEHLFVARLEAPASEWWEELASVEALAGEGSADAVIRGLIRLVPEYTPTQPAMEPSAMPGDSA